MKLFTMIFVCSIGLEAAADVKMRVVRDHKDVAPPQNAGFVTNVIALLHHCSFNSTSYAVQADTWQETLRSDSFVHVIFSAPRKIRVEAPYHIGREERAIDEILVPLPVGKTPAHIFAKSGTNVLSFTKYDQRDLKTVALEPALQLSSVPPYNSMARFPDRER